MRSNCIACGAVMIDNIMQHADSCPSNAEYLRVQGKVRANTQPKRKLATPDYKQEIEEIINDLLWDIAGVHQDHRQPMKAKATQKLTHLIETEKIAELKQIINRHNELEKQGTISIPLLIVANRINTLQRGIDK